MTPETLVVRPSFAIIVFLAAVVSPGVVLGALTLIYWEGVLPGIAVSLLAITTVLSVATIRIEIRDGAIAKYQFFRRAWSIELQHAIVFDGLAGDVPILPAVVVKDRRTGKEVGYILKTQFKAVDIRSLRSVLALDRTSCHRP